MSQITCVVNAHRESHLVYPTLRSVNRARRFARSCGLVTELIVVLDCPDSITRDIVEKNTEESDKKLVVNFCDPADSRNYAVSNVKSEYIAFIDGDDLWCESWLASAYFAAIREDKDCIYHPEYNVVFGGKHEHIFKHIDSSSDQFSVEALFDRNHWTVMSFAKASVYRETPYHRDQLCGGFGYEDWTWNFETLEKGIQHRVIGGTHHFIRRGKREKSRLDKTASIKAIPRILNLYRSKYSGSLSVNKSLSNSVPITCQISGRNVTDLNCTAWSICDFRLYRVRNIDCHTPYVIELKVNNLEQQCFCSSELDANKGIEILRDYETLDRHKVHRVHIQIVSLVHGEYKRKESIEQVILYYCPLVEVYRKRLEAIFYSQYYMSKYSLSFLESKENALLHFFNYGLYSDYSPNPWFDSMYYREKHSYRLSNVVTPLLSFLHFENHGHLNPCSFIDQNYYRQKYESSLDSAFEYFVNHGAWSDVPGKEKIETSEIQSALADMADIEPRLRLCKLGEIEKIVYPSLDRLSFLPMHLENLYGKNIHYLFCVDRISTLSKLGLSVVLAFLETFEKENVLICVTNEKESEAPALFAGLAQIAFLDIEESRTVSESRRVSVLHTVIGTLCPKKIFNFCSGATWEVLRTYGQQLSEVAELYSELQSFDDETIVRKDFRAYDYLGDVIPYLEGVIVSNSFVVSRMAELFGFPSEYMDKVHILNIPYTYKRVKDIEYAQKPGALQSERSSRSDQYTVAWLFDGSAQKGIYESVKKRMPDVEFVDLVRSKHNIFSGNDNKKYDAYLTTVVNSDYQSLLVSAAVEEIPIVAMPEGVGRGLLSSSNSWLLDVNLSEESIISAIRCCQLNTEITRVKTKVAKSDAFRRHSWEEFCSNISSVGLLSVSRKKEMNR